MLESSKQNLFAIKKNNIKWGNTYYIKNWFTNLVYQKYIYL